MKTVDMVISEWSDEEREKLKDLIEECRQREIELIKNSTACKENLIKLNESVPLLFKKSYEIKEKTEKLADDLLAYALFFDKKMPLS